MSIKTDACVGAFLGILNSDEQVSATIFVRLVKRDGYHAPLIGLYEVEVSAPYHRALAFLLKAGDRCVVDFLHIDVDGAIGGERNVSAGGVEGNAVDV